MKITILFVLICVISISYGAPSKSYANLVPAKPCKPELCKLPNCQCSSTEVPNDLDRNKIPQLVLLTFDDAVNIINYGFYEKALFNKVNPDNCPIGATFYISHEYTNYTMVHELWARGYEIALHSITHQPPTEHWKDISVEMLHREFADQLLQFEAFAKVPPSDIKGMRLPFLQLSGNNSFQMMQEVGLKYDCSWPTRQYMETGFWPYTLDYRSTQDCPITPCPKASFPGIWEIPMVDWTDDSGRECAMVDSCVDIPTDVEGILEFMKRNFRRHYNNKNKSPFGFYVHSSWFSVNPNRFTAYVQFLDYMLDLKDVYLVNSQRALQWIQNPSTIANLKNSWPSCQPTHKNQCQVNTDCQLKNEAGDPRTLSKCGGGCPEKYPYLNNPLGEDI